MSRNLFGVLPHPSAKFEVCGWCSCDTEAVSNPACIVYQVDQLCMSGHRGWGEAAGIVLAQWELQQRVHTSHIPGDLLAVEVFVYIYVCVLAVRNATERCIKSACRTLQTADRIVIYTCWL